MGGGGGGGQLICFSFSSSNCYIPYLGMRLQHKILTIQ